jgi:hypothetical protein
VQIGLVHRSSLLKLGNILDAFYEGAMWTTGSDLQQHQCLERKLKLRPHEEISRQSQETMALSHNGVPR